MNVTEKYGYRQADVNSEIFCDAEKQLMTIFEGEDISSYGYAHERILENEDTLFFNVVWIGCCGYLYIKKDRRFIRFGSNPIGWETYVWAYYEGIEIENKVDYDLTIKEIKDIEKCEEDLRPFLGRKLIYESKKAGFFELPITVKNLISRVNIEFLYLLHINEYVECEVQVSNA